MARAALSSLLSVASGRVGEEILVLTRSGLAVRQRPKYRQFAHPATAGARSRMLAAKEAWNSMSPAQVEAWRSYAHSLRKVNPANGSSYSPIAYNAFIGLATRFLQASPEGTIPLTPPSDDFLGDSVIFTVSVIGGGVLFTPSEPNAPGVKTELLVQRLPNARRAPVKFYKSLVFHTFGTEPLDVDLEPGVYVFAYRFVKLATGQGSEQLLVPGTFTVG